MCGSGNLASLGTKLIGFMVYIYVMLGSIMWSQEKRSNFLKKTLAFQVYSMFYIDPHLKDEGE